MVAGGVDAGKHLEVLGEVGGAADGGHLLDLGGGDFLDRDLSLYFAFLNAAVGQDDGLECFGFGAQLDVADECLSFLNGNLLGKLFIAHESDAECVAAFWHFVYEEEAVEVGGGTIAGSFQYDVGKGDGFTCFFVGKDSFDGLSGERGGTQKEQEKGCDSFHW